MLGREAVLAMANDTPAETPLGALVGPPYLPQLHPDHPLDTAMRYVYDWPLLPVVHRADFSRLEGVITLDDILRAYRQASRERD